MALKHESHKSVAGGAAVGQRDDGQREALSVFNSVVLDDDCGHLAGHLSLCLEACVPARVVAARGGFACMHNCARARNASIYTQSRVGGRPPPVGRRRGPSCAVWSGTGGNVLGNAGCARDAVGLGVMSIISSDCTRSLRGPRRRPSGGSAANGERRVPWDHAWGPRAPRARGTHEMLSCLV